MCGGSVRGVGASWERMGVEGAVAGVCLGVVGGAGGEGSMAGVDVRRW